ncbi:MAG: hypothetical protein H7336_12830 [Bacteriovorax sp.]|nr:hypothetical protein [Bacteriovorax sp.]
MKKTFLFILSITVAFGITFYIKKQNYTVGSTTAPDWKTFVKKGRREIASHTTTSNEFAEARIISPKKESGRAPSSIKPNPYKGLMVRNNRILMGDIDVKYEDESTELTMVNTPNPGWKEIMGNDMMRFQPEDTKLLVKEELPVIKIQGGQGRYLEQVIITYLSKDGERSSFKALVDSDSGAIVETWDRTIQEKIRPHGAASAMTIPTDNDNGVTAR